jgi:sugar diacid utilization regulator
MSRRATTVPATIATMPEDGLSDALRMATERAGQVVAAPVLAGTLLDGRFDRTCGDGSLDTTLAEAVCALSADGPDGPCASSSDAPAPWTGYRYRFGDRRAVCLLVGADDLDELATARLEAIALDLARAALLHEQRERTDQLNLLLATARSVAESLELDTVLSSIIRDATTLLGADSGDMLLWDRDRDVLHVVAVWNFPPEMLGFELRFGEGVSTQAILARHPIEVADYRAYEHRAPALDVYDFGAVLCAPLLVRGVAIGAINVHAHAGRRGFAAGSADVLAAFAGHAAIAIDHARRYENEVRLGRALAETNRQITHSLTVQQGLAEQVLLGAGLRGIATVLAEHLGRRVVIQDELHRLIAGAAPDAGDGWRGLADEGTAFTIAVRVGTDVAGHLLLSSDDDLGSIDRALVDVATTGVALEFARERAAAEVEERLRGETVTDLLTGSYTDEAAITSRTARLGYDATQPHELLVIDIAPGPAPSAALDGDGPDGADGGPDVGPDRLRTALQATRERLAVRAPRSLAAIHLGSIVVLLAPARPQELDARGLADELRGAVDTALGTATATVVVGDRCGRPDDYAATFRIARETLDLLVMLDRRGVVIGAGELGPYGLLLRASSREALESFADRALAPLVEHDRAHGGELLPTLRAYLEEGGVQRRVAARCFIQFNTVVYRVRRIQELLGVELTDPGTVFDLTLALRIRDVLAGPAGADGRDRAAISRR